METAKWPPPQETSPEEVLPRETSSLFVILPSDAVFERVSLAFGCLRQLCPSRGRQSDSATEARGCCILPSLSAFTCAGSATWLRDWKIVRVLAMAFSLSANAFSLSSNAFSRASSSAFRWASCPSAAESCFWQEQIIAREMSTESTNILFISGVNYNWSLVILSKKTEGQRLVKRNLTCLRHWWSPFPTVDRPASTRRVVAASLCRGALGRFLPSHTTT